MSATPRASFPPAAASDAHRLGRWFATARREGLLALLAPEVWHTLSALLSFTCRDGARRFTLDQLAVALGQSREAALARLDQLTRTPWQGEPLAVLEHGPQGEIMGATLAPLDVLAGAKAPLPAIREPEPPETAARPADRAPEDLVPPLQAAGLDPDQIDWLVRSFPRERLQRQLDWLPARGARNPAALLIRAVEQDWGPPREAA